MVEGAGCECTHPEFAAKRPSFNLWLVAASRNEHTSGAFCHGSLSDGNPIGEMPRQPAAEATRRCSPREFAASGPSAGGSRPVAVAIHLELWELGRGDPPHVGDRRVREPGDPPHSLRTDPLPWSSWRRARVA